MGVHRIAQVGSDAFAQPAHHIKARGRKQAQRHGDREQRQKMVFQRHHLRALVGTERPGRHGTADQPAIDEAAQGQRERERGQRRQHQKQPRQCNAPPVRFEEWKQARQGLGRLRFGAFRSHRRHMGVNTGIGRP